MNRADAERVLREGRHESGCWVDDTCECVGGDARLAAEAVLRMLPVVEAAEAHAEMWSREGWSGRPPPTLDALIEAVDAYRAALDSAGDRPVEEDDRD